MMTGSVSFLHSIFITDKQFCSAIGLPSPSEFVTEQVAGGIQHHGTNFLANGTNPSMHSFYAMSTLLRSWVTGFRKLGRCS